MGVLSRLLGGGADPKEPESDEPGAGEVWRVRAEGRPEVSLFVGELTEAPADAICTSSNPRLSLFGGTGRAVVAAAGWSVKKEAQSLVAADAARTGREGLEPGSVHVTSAGRLPFEAVIHCVASDDSHTTSTEIVGSCVRQALATADGKGIVRLAMPVFAAGHASFPFEDALRAMAVALRDAATRVEEVVLVVYRPDQAPPARQILDELFPDPQPATRTS